jgi:hypothetical protein
VFALKGDALKAEEFRSFLAYGDEGHSFHRSQMFVWTRATGSRSVYGAWCGWRSRSLRQLRWLYQVSVLELAPSPTALKNRINLFGFQLPAFNNQTARQERIMMLTRRVFVKTFALAVLLTLCPTTGLTQRLYNKDRDEQAQQSLTLAEALKNGAIFDKQLKNLAALMKKDFETEFIAARFQIDSDSLSLLTWGNAHELVCRVQQQNTDPGNIPDAAAIKTALDDLKRAIDGAKASLKAFKDSVKQEEVTIDPALASLFGRLGDLEALKDLAEKIGTVKPELVSPKTIEAITEIKDIMETLKGVYDTYKAKVDEFNKLNAELAELRVVLKKVAIQSLQVDEEHWKNIAAIRARRETERAAILSLISRYKGYIRRLGLVDFNERETDPAKRVNFCDAVRNAADSERTVDFRHFQVIAEHLKEIVVHAQSMNEANQEVLQQAKSALLKLKKNPSSAELPLSLQRTLNALQTARERINDNDIVHQYEVKAKADLQTRYDDLDSAIKSNNPARIETELRAVIAFSHLNTVAHRDMVADVPQAIYDVAAMISRGSTPSKLADLRFAQELHAYSIRKSAVRARAYELTVSTGAKRLALFHKGGIKPTDVAELVFAASNLAISPAILAR